MATEPEPKLETLSIKVEAEFKAAIDIEISRRRSTLRREVTLALASWLGIPSPIKENQSLIKES